jgi:hypothetical protein
MIKNRTAESLTQILERIRPDFFQWPHFAAQDPVLQQFTT